MQLRLLKKRTAREPGLRQPAPIADPRMNEAEMAAVYHGERMGGDFYDFLRVSPQLVPFGLLDVAGRHQENQNIVSAAQQTLRTMRTKMFSIDDINESTSMLDLSLQLNRTYIQPSGHVLSCPDCPVDCNGV